jgi:hypothetical protein
MRWSIVIVASAALGPAYIASRVEASGLVGGTPDPRTAVVRVSSSAGSCTGTYIAPGVVLTAAHCVPEGEVAPGAVLISLVDASQTPIDPVMASRGVERFETGDPVLDLAIVTINDSHVPPGTAPIPVLPPTLALAPEDVGRAVVLVGFGDQQPPGAASATGTRQGGPSTLAAVEAERATVASTPEEARACFGDSGGPLLISREGIEYVAAVLSSGASDCSGTDHYVRVDSGRGARFVDRESSLIAEGGCSAVGDRRSGSTLLALGVIRLLRRTRRAPA